LASFALIVICSFTTFGTSKADAAIYVRVNYHGGPTMDIRTGIEATTVTAEATTTIDIFTRRGNGIAVPR
jgi:hypothetical protein